ncbi:MAG: response regulator [Methylococcaceae bacterium]|nr:response regulator [Methylococcaceae bacterium]
MKILIIDDMSFYRLFLKTHLTTLGHEIITASCGEEGIKLYLEESPDLVLLDVLMPKMSGHDVAKAMRLQKKEWVPIIFLSALTDAEDIVEGIDAGADDYLFKPIKEDVLQAKIKAMVRISDMRHELIDSKKALEEANSKLQALASVEGYNLGQDNNRC